MSKTNHLQIITFGLQRTAGPYRCAKALNRHSPKSFDHLISAGE
jgi:hypothetical protein